MKKTTWKKNAAAVTALVLLLGAAAGSAAAAAVQSAGIGMEKAREIALAEPGLAGAGITESEFDAEDNAYEFELIAGDTEYEIELDAETGKVKEAESEPCEDAAAIRGEDGRIGLEKARELALKKLGLKEENVTEAEYDAEQDVYEIEAVSGGWEYEIEADAKTGEIVRTEREHSGAREAARGETDDPDDDPDDSDDDDDNEDDEDDDD